MTIRFYFRNISPTFDYRKKFKQTLVKKTKNSKIAERPVRQAKKKARDRWLNVSTTCLITVPKVTIRVMEMSPRNDLANKPTGHK